MATSVEQIRRLTIQAASTGMSAVQADLDRVAAGQTKVAQTAEVMASSTDRTTRSVLSASRQFDALTRSIDPVARAQAALEKGQRLANAAIAQGAVEAASTGKVISILEARVRAATVAQEEHGRASGLSGMQSLELAHITRSLVDEIAAGISPMRALTLEGGRIGQVFSQSGGAGAALKGVWSTVSGMLTPVMLLTGGVIGLGAAALYAFSEYEAGQRKLQQSLEGVGRASGLTLGGLNQVVSAGARIGGISAGSAQDLAGTFNATGRIGGDLSAQLIGSTKTYARVTGQDLTEAGAELAKAFADPSKGADMLNEKLGFLSGATRELIASQTASLNLMGAQRTMFDAYNDDLQKATDHTSELKKVWDKSLVSAENFFGAVGHGVAKVVTPSGEDVLKQRFGAYSSQAATTPSFLDRFSIVPHSDAAKGRTGDLLMDQWRKVTDEAAAGLRAGQTIDANRLSVSGTDLTRQILPDIGARQKLSDDAAALTAVRGNATAMNDLGVPAGELDHALAIVTERLAHFATATEKVTQDSAFAIAAITARSLSERVAIEGAKTYADTLRTSGDAALAAATAEAARNKLIADGAKAIMDNARTVGDQHALVGLSPYEKTLKENDQRYDKLARDNIVNDGATAATIRLTDALNRNADALSGKAAISGLSPIGAANSNLPAFAGGGDMASMIANSATKAGIDPTTAIRVAQSEGGLSPGRVGDAGSSFGPFQLHYGGIAAGGNRVAGMGDDYTRATGYQAGDGIHTQAEIDFALQSVAKSGSWGAFHGAARAGIGNSEGIGGIPAGHSTTVPAGASLTDINNGARATSLSDATTGAAYDAINAGNRSIEAQNALLQVQHDLMGKTPEAMAGAIKSQEMLNSLYEQGKVATLDYGSQTVDLQRKLTEYSTAVTTSAKEQSAVQRQISIQDGARSEFTDAAGTLSSDLLTHKYAGQSHRAGRIAGDLVH